MDLIGAHPGSFVATDHVAAEITQAPQRECYERALRAHHLAEERVGDPAEVDIFFRLDSRGELGAGECSAIAVALNRGYRLAIDDNKALRCAVREASLRRYKLRVVGTEGIVLELIQRGVLTIEEADDMLADWAANHRFQLRFSSFRLLLDRETGE